VLAPRVTRIEDTGFGRYETEEIVESGKKPGAVKEDDGFVARRSLHVTGPTNADGDTWQETLAGTNEK
jgi:hypothetical protein